MRSKNSSSTTSTVCGIADRSLNIMTMALFDASSLEEAGVGGILPDIGGVALFRSVFSFGGCSVCFHFDIVAGALVAAIGRRNGRHRVMAGHGNSFSLLT